jgi:hypothetical protein
VVDRVSLITILVVLGAVVWFDWLCLSDLARNRYVRYLTRQQWALVILATFPIGGVLYLTYGRARWTR